MTRILYILLLCSITLACGGPVAQQHLHVGPPAPHDSVPPTLRWDQLEYTSMFDATGATTVDVSATLVHGTDPLPSGINVRVHPLTREPFCKGTFPTCPLGGLGSVDEWLWPRVGAPWHLYNGSLHCPDDWMCGQLDCTSPNVCTVGLQLSCVPWTNASSLGNRDFKVQIDYVDENALVIITDVATVHCTW